MTGRDSCLKPRLTKQRSTVRNLKWPRERLIGGLDAIESVSDGRLSAWVRRHASGDAAHCEPHMHGAGRPSGRQQNDCAAGPTRSIIWPTWPFACRSCTTSRTRNWTNG